MLNLYLTKFINIFRHLINLILDCIISLHSQTRAEKRLLLIRLDSIGDYVLLRNFFLEFKKSKKYQEYIITLCGNIIWKDLAELLDSKTIDYFIWVNREKFNNNPFYKYRILKKIYKLGFETVIETTFSRENLFGDVLVKASRAVERIGSIGAPDSYAKWRRYLFTNRYYNKLIPNNSLNVFEFYRNKEFLEKVLEWPIGLIKPSLNVSSIEFNVPTKNKFIVFFPGAKDPKRRWSINNFALLIQLIVNRFEYDIIIAGSDDDNLMASKILLSISSNRIYDMTGKTTLPQLAKLISLAKLLVSNETSAVHFAASVSTPFVCVSNGNHFGRFNPYPEMTHVECKYVYPLEIEDSLNNYEFLSTKYRFESNLDINSVSIGKVVDSVIDFL